MSNIRIDIASEFKDKGFKQANKATGGLDKQLKGLAKTLIGVLSVREVVQFGKASVKAFSEDEKAANRLTQTLSNMGIAFEDARIKTFISDLEATSGVLDDSLRPAFQKLLTTTGSVTKSQELLALALDVAAGSGTDVVTVASDLSKAYVGQTRGLSKYSIGLTQAELKGKGFLEIQELLTNQFSGQNAAYLDTYAGKVSILNVAYANMQETVGKSLVDAFTLLAGNEGIGNATTAMQEFATAISDTVTGIAILIDKVKSIPGASLIVAGLSSMANFGALGVVRALGEQERTTVKPFNTPMTISGQSDLYTRQDKVRKKAEQDAIKRQKELLALQQKALLTQQKANRLKQISAMLAQKEAKFDLQRIQIGAALQGKVTDEEKRRLQELQTIEELKAAIAAGNLEEAEDLLKRLETLQTKTLDLATALTDLKAGDPFSEWDGYFKNAKQMINDLFANFKAQTAILDSLNKSIAESKAQANANVLAAKTDKATAYLGAADASANSARIATEDANKSIQEAADAITKATTPEEKAAAEGFMLAAQESLDAANVLTESIGGANLSAALAELELANEYLNQSIEAATGQGLIPEVNVTVNVSGNITTEQDLVTAITDQLYQVQKSGKGLLYSSVAI